MNTFRIVPLLLLMCIGIALTSCAQETSAYKDINVKKFDKLSKKSNYLMLDVRTPEEIAEGKIEGAIEMDYYADNFETEVLKLDTSKHILVYCRSGGRSAEVAEIMTKSGFKYVYNLEGGYTAWKEAHPDK